ncbi:MAG: response regulator transcription factor [Chloroflexi bacterium]|nr:response regulator transcription factor [Chloroflexota bacterium]
MVTDDHRLFRETLAGLLSAQPDMEMVGEAKDGAEAVAKARELMPDLILMDLSMPGTNGLEATRAIKSEMPYVKIVMLTVHDEDENLLEAIKSGAQGYLLKDISKEELLSSIRGIHHDEAPISRVMAGKILREFSQIAQQSQVTATPYEELTAREQEVLRLVARGASNREIATTLIISENTVKNHLRNILAKLHLQTRYQAAFYAMKKGLIKP